MKNLKVFFTFKVLLLIASVLLIILSITYIEPFSLIWHIRHGGIVEFENITINVPFNWMLRKEEDRCLTFGNLKTGSAVTIGRTFMTEGKMDDLSNKYKRIMEIDGKRAYWGREYECEFQKKCDPDKIHEYYIIPSERIIITCFGEKKDISNIQRMISNIFFIPKNELSWLEHETYHSNI